MRTTTTTAVLIAAGLLATLTACSGETSSTEEAKPTKSSDASAITPEQEAAARQAAGLPAEPNPAQRQVYLESLNAIDTDIVHGKDDKAVSRGINQCGTVKTSPNDYIKLIETTNSRFTSPDHPDGHGTIKAERILKVVRDNICPDF
ncbi:hypothetical protein ABZ424_09160 [Streptomyces sp. NPDC005790]|uniref:hypothetical protein n=1 Tax=Streptomyces sp. NPDC005790 TaxID=3154777 RepID=UPI0033E92B2F